MSGLLTKLAEAEASVESVKMQIRAALCTDVGHEWVFYGGANAGCGDVCDCSVDVLRCAKCGDFDYGDNHEANEIRYRCADLRKDDVK